MWAELWVTMSSLTDRLNNRKFPTKDITLCLDGELSQQRDSALAEFAQAKQRASERLTGGGTAEIQKRIDAIEDQMRDSLVTIRITGLPFAEYNKCIQACPPRRGKQEMFNASTFFLHTARRSSQYLDGDGTPQPITSEEWDQIEAALTDGEHDQIASAVIDVNRTQGLTGVGFLGRASATTPDSSETSASPEPTEEPPA